LPLPPIEKDVEGSRAAIESGPCRQRLQPIAGDNDKPPPHAADPPIGEGRRAHGTASQLRTRQPRAGARQLRGRRSGGRART
jgi:hypothetical protein